MSDKSTYQTILEPDEWLAERVRIQAKTFPQKFRDLNEGPQLDEILRNTETLPGTKLEQAPEVFTEQYLIEPILQGLGYLDPASRKYTGEGSHHIRQPLMGTKEESLRPDYLLKNIGKSVCIVEAKAANREEMSGTQQDATDDIRYYMQEDVFCKYLRDDKRYLIGIGTDGLRWTMWMKDIKTGEMREAVPKVDISIVVERAARRLDTIPGEASVGRDEDRQKLLEKFIPAFAAENILNHVEKQFSN